MKVYLNAQAKSEITDENVGLQFSNEDPSAKKQRILEIKDSKERDRQCALWACVFGFDELDVQDFNENPPQDLVDYRRMNKAAKEKHGSKIFALEEVEKYVEQRRRAEAHNKKTVEWLDEMIDLMDGVKDHDQISQVKERLNKIHGWYKAKYTMMDPYEQNVIIFRHHAQIPKQRNYYEPTDEERVMRELNEGK